MARTLNIYKKIVELRERYYASLPGKEPLLKMIAEAEIPEQVYNSNAIENSTLSLEETEKILLQIDLDRYVSERELFETKNLARVVEYINKRAKKQELSEEAILFLHKMLISNINDGIAGRFRTGEERVRVGTHIAPHASEIPALMKKMLAEYNASSHQHIVHRIARLHLAFEHAHPFIDGNGRIGRAINNYLLIREGYVPINIKFIDRARYYDAFKEFEANNKTSVMEEIVGRALTNSYHKRLAYLENKKIVTLSEYAKHSRVSHSNALNKAKRQTIEAFIEKGNWKIGI
ncbi:MAG: Fic family protein [Candidatus Colwellbacteria bacterium]